MNAKRTYGILRILVFVFGMPAILAFGTGLDPPSRGWAGSRDPARLQPKTDIAESDAATPRPEEIPGNEPAPEKKTPFTEFAPSERIEPDQAVDFPADI